MVGGLLGRGTLISMASGGVGRSGGYIIIWKRFGVFRGPIYSFGLGLDYYRYNAMPFQVQAGCLQVNFRRIHIVAAPLGHLFPKVSPGATCIRKSSDYFLLFALFPVLFQPYSHHFLHLLVTYFVAGVPWLKK